MKKIPTFKFALKQDLKNAEQFIPTRAESKATGWDVRSAENRVIHPLGYAKIQLGFRAFCPDGWWLELKPRSSSFAKKSLHALYGTIDETYEGQMIFACQYIPDSICNDSIEISFGEAIGQLIPVKRREMNVEVISNEEYDKLCGQRNASRGAGGFGSTSK